MYVQSDGSSSENPCRTEVNVVAPGDGSGVAEERGDAVGAGVGDRSGEEARSGALGVVALQAPVSSRLAAASVAMYRLVTTISSCGPRRPEEGPARARAGRPR